MKMKFLALVLWAIPSPSVWADELTWSQLVFNVKGEGWSAFAEAQTRWLGGIKNEQVLLLRAAGFYQWSTTLRAGLGYGIMPQALPAPRNESRLFEQLDWNPEAAENLYFTFRTRLEQRWLENTTSTLWRIRQKAQASWMPSIFGAYLWVEPFYHLNEVMGGALSGFDQCRISFGPRYKKDSVTLELGFLAQLIRNTLDQTHWNTGVMLSTSITL